MKKLLMLFIIVFFAANLIAQNIQPIAIGTALPMANKKMKSIDGKDYSIKDVQSKNGVLVMFSCNTCPVVKKYQSRTRQVIKEAKEKGFGIIIINSNDAARDNGGDSYSSMQNYAKAQGYNDIPYVIDVNSAAANAFGATRTPECFLFNASAELIYHGAIDDNQDASNAKNNYVVKAIDATVQGKAVEVKETRSVGCMIKRS